MDKKRPVRNPDIVDRKEEKEALLFDPADGNILCINSTGIFIWERCDGTRTVQEISRELTEEFDVSAGQAEKECESFLKELEKPGFIGYAF